MKKDKQYILCVNHRHFKIDIDDATFLNFLEENSQRDFQEECIDEKQLLIAYIKKTSELYEKERRIQKLLDRLEVDLSKNKV